MWSLLTLIGVMSVVFFLFQVVPGDPARMMLDQREDSEQLELIRRKYGFDQPLPVQYLYYLNDLSVLSVHKQEEGHYTHFDDRFEGKLIYEGQNYAMALKKPFLRYSFQRQGKSVAAIIGETLPNTAVLAVSAICIALVLGILLGVISALKKDLWPDRLFSILGTIGMSVPSFFSAIIMAWIFAFLLHEITGLQMTGNLYTVDDMGRGEYLTLGNLILPALTLGIRPLAVVIQLMRNSLLDELKQDYIRTAKAKGLTTFAIVFRHALRNALNPVITAVSGWFASMLAGAVFVEYIFGWNGLGKEIVNSLNTLDLPVVMGAVLVIAFLFVIINLVVDLLYAWLDPRVRIG